MSMIYNRIESFSPDWGTALVIFVGILFANFLTVWDVRKRVKTLEEQFSAFIQAFYRMADKKTAPRKK